MGRAMSDRKQDWNRPAEPDSMTGRGRLDIPSQSCFCRFVRNPSTEIAHKRTENGRTVLAEARRRDIVEALRRQGSVTVAEVEARFDVSPMTARRDLDELARRGLVRRTHGGAVMPGSSAHEDSFARRMKVSADAKRDLASEAVAMLSPRETVFLDSSTTAYFAARAIIESGMAATVLTNSLPTMELLFDEGGPQVELIGIGGNLRRLTRSFVGPSAVRTVEGHFADRLFLSVKGLTASGMMTDADPLEAEVKRAMIAQAGESTLLVDRPKLDVRGLSVVASVAEVSSVIAHGFSVAETNPLVAVGASVRTIGGEETAGFDPARRPTT
jgi:DeoR/GlpR family transcriptional regulator of sugar metabolism